MAITVDRLINDERFSGDNVAQFLLYLPLGLVLLVIRIILALILWIASIILPKKSSFRHLLSIIACCTFGVYVKLKGKRDPRCSLLVANYVSALDSLAASHTLGTISLRKWKVPPFFASSLGIMNAAQFVRKEHFADSPRSPVLLQPEGGPTNGRGLLQFCDWPFQLGNRVQPVAITVSRVFTHVTVHRAGDSADSFPWSDALWFLWTPVTRYTLTLLPPVERGGDMDDVTMVNGLRAAIAQELNVEVTEYKWDQLTRGAGSAGGAGGARREAPRGDVTRLARQVKEVLPAVPMRDILRDLAQTRSVDVTITNFLEGHTPYTPEPVAAEPAAAAASTSRPKYITPAPTGSFPGSARERQLSFKERKAQMISFARQRYIEKHGLDLALNNC